MLQPSKETTSWRHLKKALLEFWKSNTLCLGVDCRGYCPVLQFTLCKRKWEVRKHKTHQISYLFFCLTEQRNSSDHWVNHSWIFVEMAQQSPPDSTAALWLSAEKLVEWNLSLMPKERTPLISPKAFKVLICWTPFRQLKATNASKESEYSIN